MVRLKYKNIFIYLTNDEHAKLLARFDIKNFKSMNDFFQVNRRDCVLCKRYQDDSSCGKCPFNQFRRTNPGCMEIIQDLMGQDVSPPVGIGLNFIIFPNTYKNESIKLLSAIHNFLKSGVKVPYWRNGKLQKRR